MVHDDGYALLIGIDDYNAFDRSTGKPDGTSSLQGSVIDAHVFWRLCTQLGMKPENIRVVASPAPALALFPGAAAANFGDASEAGIRDALRWLADKLSGGRVGLLTYSGHGAYTRDRGFSICPSDTAGAKLDHAIPFEDLRAALGAAENLTVVLDCCHGGPTKDGRGRRARTLGGDPIPSGDHSAAMTIGACVLAACRPGEPTQQAAFSGMWRGAFSWALAAVVDQWKAVDEGGNVRLDLSNGTLVDKARQLLSVLEFAGTPTLYGAKGVEARAVLQVGSRPEPTSATPDGARKQVQMDPGNKGLRYYELQDPAGRVAIVVVPRTGDSKYPDYQPGTEYWLDVRSSPPSEKLTVSWTDYDWGDQPTLPATSFPMTRRVDWTKLSDAPTAAKDLFVSNQHHVGVAWGVSFDRATSTWSGSLTWYNYDAHDNAFGRDTSPVELSADEDPDRTITWYQGVAATGT